MELNLPVIIIVSIAALILVIFLIRRNQKDEKKFEREINENYKKHPDHEKDVDIEDTRSV